MAEITPELELLREQVSQLRRSQRHWQRGAMLLLAIAIAASLGWAPLDQKPKIDPLAPLDDLPATASNDAGDSAEAAVQSNDHYQPTCGEWLTVFFNSTYRIDKMATHGYRINYVCPPETDKVIIHVARQANADEEAMQSSVELAKNMVVTYAQSKDWDWLTAEEKYVTVAAPRETLHAGNRSPSAQEQGEAAISKDELKETVKESLRDALKEVLGSGGLNPTPVPPSVPNASDVEP